MVEEALGPGFPPDEALWRLLVKKGHEGGFQAFKEVHWGGPEPEHMAETLEALGFQARAAVLEGAELGHLEPPTLVEQKDLTWVILENSGGRRVQVELPEGGRSVPAAVLRDALSGRVLELSPGLPPGTTLAARLKALFLLQRRTLLSAAGATLLLQALVLAMPAFTALVLDRALPDGARSMLFLVGLGMLLTTLHRAWFGWLRDRALLFVAARVAVAAERGFLEHLLRCPFPFLQKRTVGELMQACAGFKAARDLLPMRTVGALLNGSMAFVLLAVMGAVLPGPTLILVLVTALLGLTALGAGRLEAGLEAREVEARAREHGLLIELVAGIGTLKGAGAEGRGLARWVGAFRKVLRLAMAREKLNLGASLGMGLLSQGLTVALLIWGGRRLLAGTLRVGTLFAFLQMSSGFMEAVLAMVQVLITLMILKPQLARAQEILAVEPEARPRRAPPSPDPVAVAMEGVWFRYTPEGPWILRNHVLRVEAGGKRALSGPSGLGKTTVLRLLAGLHVPERGTVRIAGKSPRDQRSNLIYLPQFVQLFAGTLLDNLRVFSCGAPLDRLRAAAARTGLADLVASLPMGYLTILPPGGGTLSGGQRQLVALTGVLASGRPLLLLDEATANLDARQASNIEQLIARGDWTGVTVGHAR